MSLKQAILAVGAIALIIIVVFSRRPSALPMLENAGDPVLAAGKQRVSAEELFSPRRHGARPPLPSEDELEYVRQLAESDPRAAALCAGQFPATALRVDAIEAVAIAWANQDLPSAIEWSHQLADENERQRAQICIAFEAARAEPLTALALAIPLNADPDRDELIRHAAGEWAATAPEAAAEWARRIENAPLRTRTLASIATVWAEMDPRAAATLAIEELEAGRLREDTVVGVVQRWAQREPADAAAWIVTFEEGELRAAALYNLVKLWADQNPTEAGEWLKGLGPGSMRSLAIAAYVEQIAPAFPQQASQWAGFGGLNSP
jgi:hypothetical protein